MVIQTGKQHMQTARINFRIRVRKLQNMVYYFDEKNDLVDKNIGRFSSSEYDPAVAWIEENPCAQHRGRSWVYSIQKGHCFPKWTVCEKLNNLLTLKFITTYRCYFIVKGCVCHKKN